MPCLVGKKFKASGCAAIQDVINITFADPDYAEAADFNLVGKAKVEFCVEFVRKLTCTSWEVLINDTLGIAKQSHDGTLTITGVYKYELALTDYYEDLGQIFGDLEKITVSGNIQMKGKVCGKTLKLDIEYETEFDESNNFDELVYEEVDWVNTALASLTFKQVC